MREISMTNVKVGQLLAQPVITSLGGTLFNKGHEVTKKDYQILSAFLIDTIFIVTPNNEPSKSKEPVKSKETVVTAEIEKRLSIEETYLQIVKQTNKVFLDIEGGLTPPILDIRSYLIPFVQNALNYPTIILDLLKFSNSRSYIAHHAVSVAVITSYLAIKAGFNPKEIPQISLAGYLHNVGQLKIHPTILNKKIALTQDEFEEIQRHPTFGYDILKKIAGISEGVILGALQHHEREDGSGYPLGLISAKIHPYAKMIAISDIYYAMCAERSYKQAQSPFLVVEQLKNDSYGKLDPKFVYLFVELITNYLCIGSKVMLSNGLFGEIVYVDKNTPTKPMVNCDGEIINLQKIKDVYIEHVEI